MAKLLLEYDFDKDDLELHESLSSSRRFFFGVEEQKKRLEKDERGRMWEGIVIIVLLVLSVGQTEYWSFFSIAIPSMILVFFLRKKGRKAFWQRIRNMEERVAKTGEIKFGITLEHLYDYDDAKRYFMVPVTEVKGIEENEHFFLITITDKLNFIIPKYKLTYTTVTKTRLRLQQVARSLGQEYYSTEEE